jgi:hypothetical protein
MASSLSFTDSLADKLRAAFGLLLASSASFFVSLSSSIFSAKF